MKKKEMSQELKDTIASLPPNVRETVHGFSTDLGFVDYQYDRATDDFVLMNAGLWGVEEGELPRELAESVILASVADPEEKHALPDACGCQECAVQRLQAYWARALSRLAKRL